MRAFLDLILENWAVKLAAVFVAVTLWMLVRGDSSAERVITVPLEVRIPRNMEITNERPSTVDVTVRGPVSNVWFGQTLPTCGIDLEQAGEGEHIVPVSPANVRIPRATGLEVLSVRPARLTLVLERTTSRQLPVQLSISGEPQPGFEIYERHVAPATTMVTGPRSRVGRLREVRTEAVSVSGLRESVRSLVGLVIRDSFVHASPDMVEVRIDIGVQRRLQTLSRIPVQADEPGLTVTPSRVSIQVLVPIYYEQRLVAADFTATVSLRDLDPALPAAKVRPSIRFTARDDPSVLVREIRPPEVTVVRSGKN